MKKYLSEIIAVIFLGSWLFWLLSLAYIIGGNILERAIIALFMTSTVMDRWKHSEKHEKEKK